MNMLSKPVERCRKTSYSLNLSLVLSALNALYKLFEKFCCILSLKTLTGDAHLCPERAQDELASARGAHGGEEVGVLPRVASGSVERRAFRRAGPRARGRWALLGRTKR